MDLQNEYRYMMMIYTGKDYIMNSGNRGVLFLSMDLAVKVKPEN